MRVHPWNTRPETSPCGDIGLYIARFGESHTPFEFMNLNGAQYIELIQAAREV